MARTKINSRQVLFDDEFDIKELSSNPSNPSAGNKRLFAKNDDQIYALNSGGGKTLLSTNEFCIPFIIDGGGALINTGVQGGLYITFPYLIVEYTIASIDPLTTSGSIVVDIWTDTYANFPPTVADSITASAKPTISSGVKAQTTSLTGWTTTQTAGKWIYYNVDSVSGFTKICLTLKCIRI